MVPQLGPVTVFEQGLQQTQGFVPVQLCRRPGVIVCQRQIGCPVRADSERNPDDFGLDIIKTGGLGIEGKQGGGFKDLDPFREFGPGQDGLDCFAVFRSAPVAPLRRVTMILSASDSTTPAVPVDRGRWLSAVPGYSQGRRHISG